MNTMAPLAATSHTSRRWTAKRRGDPVIAAVGPAIAVYAIDISNTQTHATTPDDAEVRSQ
jgi:hypothetical protein